MSDEPILVPLVPLPANTSRNKPVYIVVATDPTAKDKIRYYKSSKVLMMDSHLRLMGWELKKAQADKISKNPNAEVKADKEVHVELPWQKIIRIINISYKIKQQ